MTTIDQELTDLAEEFDLLGDWEERYRYVIELGRELAPLADAERNEANKVRGCASQVWLVTETTGNPEDPVLTFEGESDAHIVRGLVAIVLTIYSGKHASEIAKIDAIDTFSKIGLIEHLSTQRANGLRSMIRRIKSEAELRLAA